VRGTIRQRSAGSWTVIVDLGPDPVTGRRRQHWKTVRGPKREAEAELAKLIHERSTGIEQPTGHETVAEYLDRWLRDYVATNTAPKTEQTYREIAKRHLVPAFGALELVALRPAHIQAFYGRMLRSGRVDGKGGLSARSVLRYHQVIHAALHQAVRWQLLVRNPADAVEPPRAERREVMGLKPGQVRALFAAADMTPIGHLVRTAVLTGLRRGELLGLRWSDVDMDRAVLHVQQTAQRITGRGVIFRQPKTRLSRRAVALSPDAVAVLRAHRREQLEERLLAGPAYGDRDLVFASAIGTSLEAGTITRTWTRILAVAGVGHVRWHDLRHAHATLLLRQGVHPKIVSERLGHASVGITLDTYSHVLPGLQAAAAAALDLALAEEDIAEAR
jgi:integrase